MVAEFFEAVLGKLHNPFVAAAVAAVASGCLMWFVLDTQVEARVDAYKTQTETFKQLRDDANAAFQRQSSEGAAALIQRDEARAIIEKLTREFEGMVPRSELDAAREEAASLRNELRKYSDVQEALDVPQSRRFSNPVEWCPWHRRGPCFDISEVKRDRFGDVSVVLLNSRVWPRSVRFGSEPGFIAYREGFTWGAKQYALSFRSFRSESKGEFELVVDSAQ